MATITRRTWTLATLGALIVIGLAGTAAWLTSRQHHPDHSPDCATVRAMIDYNTAQAKQLGAAFNPEQDTQPPVSDYQNWADHLGGYAAAIHQPDLADHASRLADHARQMVVLVTHARSNTTVPADPQAPPPWTHAYSELAHQTHTELVALNTACPPH